MNEWMNEWMKNMLSSESKRKIITEIKSLNDNKTEQTNIKKPTKPELDPNNNDLLAQN